MKKFTLLIFVMFLTSAVVFAQATQKKITKSEQGYSQVLTKTTPKIVNNNNSNSRATDYTIDFEDEVEWTFDFDPWTVNDVDGLATYGFTTVDFPNEHEPMAYIVFDPDLTTPPMTDDPEIQPHSGEKFGACIASVPNGSQGNDDWFISPFVSLGSSPSVTFWAKSYTDEYGLEKFNVGVSTLTNDPADFTIISGATPLEAPMAWTEYTFDLSAYEGQDIYFAIQCVSFDAFVFMIDDIVIDPGTSCFPYFDAFESYVADDYLALQAGCWTTWSGAPGTSEDAFVVTTEAYSGVQSVKVDGSSTDLIFPLGDKTDGKYVVSMDILIASGCGGYYNLMHSFGATNEWAIEVYFASDGTGYIHAGGDNAATFVYPNGDWFNARIYVDLDLDWATYLVNDEFVHAWQWSLTSQGNPGLNQLGVVDIFAAAPTGDDVLFYIDNFYYYYDDGCEYFEDYLIGEYIGLQSPWWTTWSYNPGSSEDALVTDVIAPYKSLLIDAGTDLVRPFNYENFTDCKYGVYFWFMVADGYCGYFNLQKDIVPGVEWGMQVQWDVDGIGTIDAGAQAAATFPFSFDEWYYIELIVDLDNDLGEIWIDDVLIHTWQWSLGCFGDPGMIALGSINVFAWNSTGNSPLAYFDDLCFEQLTYVGIGENIEVNSNISVYPNPANDFVNIESSANINEVKIFNNLGQIVYSQKIDNNFVRINTEKFITGIYHIQINSQDGIKTQKLVIK